MNKDFTAVSLGSGVKIERASVQDCTRIGEIHAQTMHEIYADHMPANALRKITPERMAKDWRDSIDDPDILDFLVVKEDGHVVGFGVSVMDTTLSPAMPKLSECHVDPQSRGKGYGKALMQCRLSHLADAGYNAASIYVAKGNEKVKQIYEGMGAFVQEEVSHNILRFRVDHYQMCFPDIGTYSMEHHAGEKSVRTQKID